MKRFLTVLIFAAFFIPGIAYAGFEHKTQQDVMKSLKQFYDVEQGNRLTGYSMRALLMDINKIFQANIIIPERPEKEMKDGPINQ